MPRCRPDRAPRLKGQGLGIERRDGLRYAPLKLREIGQPVAAIGDQEFQQGLPAHRIDAAALDAALPALRHQANSDELRDMMCERRLRNSQLLLNGADRQSLFARLDQYPEYLEPVKMTELRQTSRRIVERQRLHIVCDLIHRAQNPDDKPAPGGDVRYRRQSVPLEA